MTTTTRGYGTTHQQARRAALHALQDGDTCAHHNDIPECPGPMYHHQQLDLAHNTDRTAYLGLAHAHCNRADGNHQRGKLWESSDW